MNKKFSTLMALALVVGSASAQNWQHLTSNDLQGAYRTYGTVNGSETVADNAAITKEDAGTYTLATQGTFDKLINFIDDTKWYQLEVGQDGKIFSGANGTFVLIQERDTETGKVYLRAMPKATAEKNGAKLNASLWKIEYTKNDGVSGGYFRYINKETNLAITFDHTLIKNAEVSELRAGVNDWSWYTVNKNSAKFGLERVYSYLHNQADGEVMYLAFANNATNKDAVLSTLNTNGFEYATSAGYLVQAKVIKADAVGTGLANIAAEALQLRPVVAMPFFMNAKQFNTRMDADQRMNDKDFTFKLAPDNLIGAEAFAGTFSAEENIYELTDGSFENEGDADLKAITNGFNLSFKRGTEGYLRPALERYEEKNIKPSASPSVKFEVAPKEATTANSYLKARHYFRATYFPTNDSIVIEPLNAAVQSDKEWDQGTAWTASACCTSFYVNDFTKANTLVNKYDGWTSKTVSITAAEINGLGKVITVAKDGKNEFKVKTTINRPFAYLQRATKENGLYFIELGNAKANGRYRAQGMKLVANMAGELMYDTQAENQDYGTMPATMWMVEQLGCKDMNYYGTDTAKYVKITNREYPIVAFVGQLYSTDGKNYRFINRSADYNWTFDASKLGMFDTKFFSVNDTLWFTPVTEAEHPAAYEKEHGYKRFSADELNDGIENNYNIKLNNFLNDNLYLQAAKDMGYVASLEDAKDAVAFEIAQATYETTGGVVTNDYSSALKKVDGTDLLPKLYREAYIIKVKDKNLIDNDRLYMASVKGNDGRYYYRAVKKSDLNDNTVKLAYFYLKADQVRFDADKNVTDTCYVLVDIKEPGVEKLKSDNGWMKVAVESGNTMGVLRDNDLNDRPNEVSNAFYLPDAIVRKQYIDLNADYAMPLNNTIKIWRKAGNSNEYLFEDNADASGVQSTTGQKISKTLGYLGIENKGVTAEAAAIYVDEVLASKDTHMPQYLLGVAVDSIPNGVACDENQKHGYWKTAAEADKTDCHYANYQGYTAGRFLVNLNDSIEYDNSHAMLGDASSYKYQGLTRLAFVEGVHVVTTTGEYLYIVKRGKTLKEAMTVKDNSGVSDESYIKKGFVLSWSKLAEIADKHDLKKTTHSNYAFSLRKVTDKDDETSAASEGFLLESNDAENSASVGGFKGAWVNVVNGVPVLAQNSTKTEDHESAEGNIQELINQAQVFHFGETDEEATANEGIEAASTITVVATNGAVIVKGAEGKAVTITNVLGQTIANTVIASSEATISAPAGVVVVAVEGEAAVKAIVK